MTYQRNEAPEPLASDAPPVWKWCDNCRKEGHLTGECWSTHAKIGSHDASPADMQFPTAFAWPEDIAAQAKP